MKLSSKSITLLHVLIVPFVAAQSSLFRSSETEPTSTSSSSSSSSSLVWAPLRATFRPLNRQSPPPPPPESSALVSEPSSDSPSTFDFINSRFTQPIITTTSTTTTPAPALNFDDDELPTRIPSNRFRPTKTPSVDSPASGSPSPSSLSTNSGSHNLTSSPSSQPNGSSAINVANSLYRITNECFECICEASTSCNTNSRCQTSDVRHTRCGLFLISYNQWLESGLSKQLVTREALLRDAAADERAFYECVTDRACGENLLKIYMDKHLRDCDKDGKIDCYDVAAIHQGGLDNCNAESLLDSQYWSDFNACFGFGR